MYKIRQAVASDCSGQSQLLLEATEDIRRIYCPVPDVNSSLEKKGQKGKAKNNDWLVVDSAGSILGSFEMVCETDGLLLRTVAVARIARRRGIFRMMLSFARETAMAEGIGLIRVVTIQETGNPVIFQRCGFVVTDIVSSKRFVSVEGLPVYEVTMELGLSADAADSISEDM